MKGDSYAGPGRGMMTPTGAGERALALWREPVPEVPMPSIAAWGTRAPAGVRAIRRAWSRRTGR